MTLHRDTRVEQPGEWSGDQIIEPIARETGGDQTIVVWPYRAIVIGHRVVPRVGGGQRPDSPTGKHFLSHELLRDATCAIRCRNTAEQTVAGVRGSYATRTFMTVEGERIGRFVVTPESILERLTESFGLPAQLIGALGRAEHVGKCRRALPGIVDVRLHLTQGNGRLRRRAVGVKDRILRVLPSLLNQAGRGLACVFDEAVTVPISV